jgi:AraC family transcriptional regulator, regulatory protein of adaptative response / DNA-3-methyladenine glycosylase II
LPHGDAVLSLTAPADATGPSTAGGAAAEDAPAVIEAEIVPADDADLPAAIDAARRLLDLDLDPAEADSVLAADARLRPWVAVRPGVRLPGAVDGTELLVRAVVGQQISVAGARTVAGRLVAAYGVPIGTADRSGALTHRFPTAEALAAVDPEVLPMPRARARSLVGACDAVACGRVRLEPGADPGETRRALLALPGIGPWTADYLLLRCLGERDVFLATDLGIRRAFERLGLDGRPGPAAATARAWAPWRSHAVLHLWLSLEV